MEINLYLRTLQRGWWIILLTVLIATNVSLITSYFTPPVYQTSARFIVAPNAGSFSSSWDVVSSLDTLDRRSIINTYRELLASSSVYRQNPQIQKIAPEVLASYDISVTVVPDTNILQLTVEGVDPNLTVELADAIGTQAVDYINKLYPVYIFSILDQPELPIAPIRPQPIQNAGLAFFFGAIIGLVLAFSKEQLQTSIEKLRERSIVDVPSSAYTRAYFERRLLEEIAQRPEHSLSLGMINFRGLADVADILPQQIMDRIINTVTQTLKSELRGRDVVGRWGDMQLAVLLPSTPISAVEATFKRIQLYLAETISVDTSGDMIVKPDPCIGVVGRNQLETGEELIARGVNAMEKASALDEASVVVLSTPFIFAKPDSSVNSSELG